MDRWVKMRRIGYVLAILGLLVAVTAVIPGIFAKGEFPYTLLVGSFIYLHGGLLVVFGSRGIDPKQSVGSLRLIRFGFILIFAILIAQIVGS